MMRTAVALASALALMAPAAARAEGPHGPGGARPDLTGVWTNASLTQLSRPPGVPNLLLAEAEALAVARANPMLRRSEADARPTDPADGPPAEGGANIGVNAFWLDAGDQFARVQGQLRSSWIVEPASGQLPLTTAGLRRSHEAAATRARQDPTGGEHLAPNDRCLIGSRGSGGPGMLNNIYNSNYQIIQTPDALAIVVEMVHDVRTIPIHAGRALARASHEAAALQPWLGDSVGWWEGHTLVVETVHINPQQGRFGPIFLSPEGRVTERFRWVSPGEIFYAFEVEDPVHYTAVWRAEMSLRAIPGPLYEYACHEGNYALGGILGGARRAEARRRAEE